MSSRRYIMKALIGAPLAYATWTVFTCPCDRIPNCHLSSVYAALGLSVFFLMVENGVTFKGDNEYPWLGGSAPSGKTSTSGAPAQSFTESELAKQAAASV